MATTTLAAFLTKFNNLIGDDFTGTTTSAGNAGKTTLIDSGLCKYGDGFFGDPDENPEWWVYVSSQLRPIKKFAADTGTISVFTAFSAQIGASTTYALHHYDRNRKIAAINQALNDAYPYFYARVEDATTLDGTGASANKYQVPATFTEFPDKIKKKHTSGTKYTITDITDFTAEEISGTRYFYADITEDDDIILVGKTYLTQFTTDASTTELSSSQADVVCLLAAANFYRNLSANVNSEDSGRFDSLSNRFEAMWNEKKMTARMPMIHSDKLDWGWTK